MLLALALPLVDVGRAGRATLSVDIVAVDLAGHRTNLTQNPAIDSAPSVARDGRIVFVTTRDALPQLYVAIGEASRSPNGRTLAVVAGTTADRYGGESRNRRLETVQAKNSVSAASRSSP